MFNIGDTVVIKRTNKTKTSKLYQEAIGKAGRIVDFNSKTYQGITDIVYYVSIDGMKNSRMYNGTFCFSPSELMYKDTTQCFINLFKTIDKRKQKLSAEISSLNSFKFELTRKMCDKDFMDYLCYNYSNKFMRMADVNTPTIEMLNYLNKVFIEYVQLKKEKKNGNN